MEYCFSNLNVQIQLKPEFDPNSGHTCHRGAHNMRALRLNDCFDHQHLYSSRPTPQDAMSRLEPWMADRVCTYMQEYEEAQAP